MDNDQNTTPETDTHDEASTTGIRRGAYRRERVYSDGTDRTLMAAMQQRRRRATVAVMAPAARRVLDEWREMVIESTTRLGGILDELAEWGAGDDPEVPDVVLEWVAAHERCGEPCHHATCQLAPSFDRFDGSAHGEYGLLYHVMAMAAGYDSPSVSESDAPDTPSNAMRSLAGAIEAWTALQSTATDRRLRDALDRVEVRRAG